MFVNFCLRVVQPLLTAFRSLLVGHRHVRVETFLDRSVQKRTAPGAARLPMACGTCPGSHFFLNRASSFDREDATRLEVSSGAPSLKVKKVQKFAFSRSGMYSAMCSLH